MNLKELEPTTPVRRHQIVARGIQGLCPNCGEAKIFKSRLKIHRQCPHCGMTLERGDGFYLGPLCINYGMLAFFYVAPLLLCGFMGWFPLKTTIAVAFVGAITLPLALYRVSWSLWLMAYYFCLPEELHANRPEGTDDLSFEEEARR